MKSLNTLGKDVNALEIKFSTLTSNKVTMNLRKLKADQTLLITSMATRWDMISQYLYEDSSYDWILALINGVKSEDLKIGMTVRFPIMSDLTKFLTDYV